LKGSRNEKEMMKLCYENSLFTPFSDVALFHYHGFLSLQPTTLVFAAVYIVEVTAVILRN
jgi:hypothetical protein